VLDQREVAARNRRRLLARRNPAIQ